jgi:molybdenum cofactor biosynthesis enzyme MoaA
MSIQRLSIELTNRCSKKCHFCYNESSSMGQTIWQPDELVNFVVDCAKAGTQAVSFGGGEPLEYVGLFEVLRRLQGVVFRSFTTNGLHLNDETLEQVVIAAPDKVHVSIHFPETLPEVQRVTNQVNLLASRGIRSGVNLLVSKSNLAAATEAARMLNEAGIGNDRIVYLPMRGLDTPSPQQIAQAAGGKPFQSMTCLSACAKSERFCAISWDKQVAWCSYTVARRPLPSLTAAALESTLQDMPLVFCGDQKRMEEI